MTSLYVPPNALRAADIAYRLAEMLASAYLAKVTITIDEGSHGCHTVEINKQLGAMRDERADDR